MSDNVSKEIRSMVTNDGNIELSIKTSEIPTPSADEVIIKVEAAPINPSDLGLLLSFAADISSISTSGSGDETITTMKIHPALMGAMKPRLDESMQVGNEGAGVIVDAGDNVKDLIGKTVGLAGGAMYSQYRCVPAASCLVMDEGYIAFRGCLFICESFNCTIFYRNYENGKSYSTGAHCSSIKSWSNASKDL
jgi:NADPH2:quinone reductase